LIKKLIILFTFLVSLLICCTDRHRSKEAGADYSSSDLDSIRARGKLIAITDFNSTDYFIYRGEPMGFNYELLKSFSDFIGIDLEIISVNNFDRAYKMVGSGKADLLAFGLTPGSGTDYGIKLTEAIDETAKVLVRRKFSGHRSMIAKGLNKKLISRENGISGKTIYVQEKSLGREQLAAIRNETGDTAMIVEVPYEPERLIRYVADGVIDYAICDENVAQVNATYYDDIDAGTTLSLPQGLAWGVRQSNSEKLLYELNRWIDAYRKTGSYALLHAKYFSNSRSNIIVKSDYYSLNTGKVSRYDDLIREFSGKINWDWRLLASLICQESQFRPDVTSGAGAYGLMQIMPVTGKNFGIDIKSSPENNIRAGTLYIAWLNSIFDSKIPDERERLYFILASYNAGPGHVLDAMRLAEKNGMDPQKWNGNVALWLLKKSEPQYFRDSVVKNGYFRGIESVRFVSEVLGRFEHYKNIIPSDQGNTF
jgi:peptidoglycan lytic transglycosylase F